MKTIKCKKNYPMKPGQITDVTYHRRLIKEHGILKANLIRARISTNMRNIRLANDLNCKEMAMVLGSKHGSLIQQFEHMSKLPSEEAVKKLCDYFNIPFTKFLDETLVLSYKWVK